MITKGVKKERNTQFKRTFSEVTFENFLLTKVLNITVISQFVV